LDCAQKISTPFGSNYCTSLNYPVHQVSCKSWNRQDKN
jgi:hypothetical protein